MIWAGSIHRKLNLYPCWMPKGPRRDRARWLIRAMWKRWEKAEIKDYWRNHKLYNLVDNDVGVYPQWRHMWRKRP